MNESQEKSGLMAELGIEVISMGGIAIVTVQQRALCAVNIRPTASVEAYMEQIRALLLDEPEDGVGLTIDGEAEVVAEFQGLPPAGQQYFDVGDGSLLLLAEQPMAVVDIRPEPLDDYEDGRPVIPPVKAKNPDRSSWSAGRPPRRGGVQGFRPGRVDHAPHTLHRHRF